MVATRVPEPPLRLDHRGRAGRPTRRRAGWNVGGPLPAVLGATLAAGVAFLPGRLPALVAAAAAVVLAVRGDLHGASLCAGLLAGWAAVRQDRTRWTR
jgi:hypothetical protein